MTNKTSHHMVIWVDKGPGTEKRLLLIAYITSSGLTVTRQPDFLKLGTAFTGHATISGTLEELRLRDLCLREPHEAMIESAPGEPRPPSAATRNRLWLDISGIEDGAWRRLYEYVQTLGMSTDWMIPPLSETDVTSVEPEEEPSAEAEERGAKRMSIPKEKPAAVIWRFASEPPKMNRKSEMKMMKKGEVLVLFLKSPQSEQTGLADKPRRGADLIVTFDAEEYEARVGLNKTEGGEHFSFMLKSHLITSEDVERVLGWWNDGQLPPTWIEMPYRDEGCDEGSHPRQGPPTPPPASSGDLPLEAAIPVFQGVGGLPGMVPDRQTGIFPSADPEEPETQVSSEFSGPFPVRGSWNQDSSDILQRVLGYSLPEDVEYSQDQDDPSTDETPHIVTEESDPDAEDTGQTAQEWKIPPGEMPRGEQDDQPTDAMSDGAERRAHPRVMFEQRVRVGEAYGEFYATVETKDLSVGGLFIVNDSEVQIGTHFCVEVSLGGNTAYIPDAKVVHRRRNVQGRQVGFGVRFLKLTDEAKECLERITRQPTPGFRLEVFHDDRGCCGEELVTRGDNVDIGRSDNCRILLKDLTGGCSTVSRQHAEIVWRGDRARIYDLASSNGTAVNSIRVDEHGSGLNDGDVIKIGNFRLVFTEVKDVNNWEPPRFTVNLYPASLEFSTVFAQDVVIVKGKLMVYQEGWDEGDVLSMEISLLNGTRATIKRLKVIIGAEGATLEPADAESQEQLDRALADRGYGWYRQIRKQTLPPAQDEPSQSRGAAEGEVERMVQAMVDDNDRQGTETGTTPRAPEMRLNNTLITWLKRIGIAIAGLLAWAVFDSFLAALFVWLFLAFWQEILLWGSQNEKVAPYIKKGEVVFATVRHGIGKGISMLKRFARYAFVGLAVFTIGAIFLLGLITLIDSDVGGQSANQVRKGVSTITISFGQGVIAAGSWAYDAVFNEDKPVKITETTTPPPTGPSLKDLPVDEVPSTTKPSAPAAAPVPKPAPTPALPATPKSIDQCIDARHTVENQYACCAKFDTAEQRVACKKAVEVK